MRERFGNAEMFDVEVVDRTVVELKSDTVVSQLYLAWKCPSKASRPRVIRVRMRCPQLCLQWLSECNGDDRFISEWFDAIMRRYAAEEIGRWPMKWRSAEPMALGDGINWESAV